MRELQALHGMRISKEPVAVGILVSEPDFEQLLGLLNDFRILFLQEDLDLILDTLLLSRNGNERPKILVLLAEIFFCLVELTCMLPFLQC